MTDKSSKHRFCWNELATSNLARAKDFYGKLLGWTFEEMPAGEMIYTSIHHGDNGDAFGGIWEIPAELADEVPPHWMGYVTVENLDETLKNAVAQGATIKMPVTQAGEKGKFAVIQDPTGAHIAFWESLTSC